MNIHERNAELLVHVEDNMEHYKYWTEAEEMRDLAAALRETDDALKVAERERDNAVKYEQDVEELAKCRGQLEVVKRERDALKLQRNQS